MTYGPFLKKEYAVLHGTNASDLVKGYDHAKLDALIALAGELFSMENVGFLCAVEQYRRKAQHQSYMIPPQLFMKGMLIPQSAWGGANTMGNWVYTTYIPEGAKHQVNISAANRLELEKIAKQRATPFIPPNFDAAFGEVARMVKKDWLNRVLEPPKKA